MLPKKYRLNNEPDILRAMRSRRYINSKYFTLKYFPSPTSIRFGFVVSKKAASKPVVRNLIKRRMRDIVSRKLKDFSEKGDFLFLARPAAASASFEEIKTAIDSSISQITSKLGKR